MADTERLQQLLTQVRADAADDASRGRRRIGLLVVMTVACCGYMTWLFGQLGQLDAQAISEVARAEAQRRLPEVQDRLTALAIDAAPQVMDRAEHALLNAPHAVRDHLEVRLLDGTELLVRQTAEQLDQEIGSIADEHLRTLEESGAGELGPEQLDELMTQLRTDYRTKASGLLDQLYVGYAKEIRGLDDYLVRLRDDAHLSERERIHREIVAASAVLRERHVTAVTPAKRVGRDD